METGLNINQLLILIGELYVKNKLLTDEVEALTQELDQCRSQVEERAVQHG